MSGLTAPPAVLWIVRTLEEHGFETWTVGGAVRDALLARPSGDWDLATRARPADVRRVFKRTVPVGIEHGTVGVLARDGTMYEVTTFRRDVETDGRHAVVSFADRIEDDLARRDFTINAVAWHPLTERIFDPFGGRADLEARLLRTVGDPAERFREDHLRVLRAFRFAGRFGLSIEPATWAAIRSVSDRLGELSAERVRDELLKVLDGDSTPSAALRLYASSGALEELYPELEEERSVTVPGTSSSSWDLTCATADALPVGNAPLRLAALLRRLGTERAAPLLFRLRLSNAQVDGALRLIGAPDLPAPDADDATFRRWLARVGRDAWASAARLRLTEVTALEDAHRAAAPETDSPPTGRGATSREVIASWTKARRIRDLAPPLAVGDLAIDGRALIALGLRPGPRFGDILEELLEWVLDDPSRNTEEALVKRVLALEGLDHA